MEETISIVTLIAAVGALASSLIGIWVTRLHANESERLRLASQLHERRITVYEEVADRAWALHEVTIRIGNVHEDREQLQIADVATWRLNLNELIAALGRKQHLLSNNLSEALAKYIDAADDVIAQGITDRAGTVRPYSPDAYKHCDEAYDRIVEMMKIDLRVQELTDHFVSLIPHLKRAPEAPALPPGKAASK